MRISAMFWGTVLGMGVALACSSSDVSTGPCSTNECGAVPPIDPFVCNGRSVSTPCNRVSGKCQYVVVCGSSDAGKD